MNKNKLTNALAKAQRLMLDETFNQKVEAYAAQRGGRRNGISNAEIAMLEEQAFGRRGGGSSQGRQQIQMIQENATYEPQQQQIDFESSKLPKAILESFKQTAPMSGEQSSDISPVAEAMSGLMLKRPAAQMNENTIPSQSYGIDYGVLKAIIDESVRTNVQELLKGRLNESAGTPLRGIKIIDGNRIQLLDTDGNLYEGVLQFKKRVVKG